MTSAKHPLLTCMSLFGLSLVASAQIALAQPLLAQKSEPSSPEQIKACQQTKEEYIKTRLALAQRKGQKLNAEGLSAEFDAKCAERPYETRREMSREVLMLILSKGLKR